jgi:YVTN family beta-propeller protein
VFNHLCIVFRATPISNIFNQSKHMRTLLFLVFLCFFACKPEKDPVVIIKDPNLILNYPALFVANSEDNILSVIDLATQSVRDKIVLQQGTHPYHLSISPDKTRLAVAMTDEDLSEGLSNEQSGNNFYILILDATNANQLHSIKLDAQAQNAIWSKDGKTLWVGQSQDDKVLVFEGSGDYKLIKAISAGSDVAEVSFSPDGSWIFAANTGSDAITVIDPMTYEIEKTITVGDKPTGAWPATNGKMIVTNQSSKTLSIIDLATHEVEKTVELGFTPTFALFNELDFRIWVCDKDNGDLVAFQQDGLDWLESNRTKTGAGAHQITFVPNGKAYISNQNAGTITLVNSSTREKIKEINVGGKPCGMVVKN